MQTTALNAIVLTGQGAGGSFSVTVPNPAPAQGPAAGVDAIQAPQVDASAATAGAITPTDWYPNTGGPATSDSQYSTIGPIPEG